MNDGYDEITGKNIIHKCIELFLNAETKRQLKLKKARRNLRVVQNLQNKRKTMSKKPSVEKSSSANLGATLPKIKTDKLSGTSLSNFVVAAPDNKLKTPTVPKLE